MQPYADSFHRSVTFNIVVIYLLERGFLMITRTWFLAESRQRERKKPKRKDTMNKYKLWIPEDNMGILSHVKSLGGAYVKLTENIYEIHGISTRKLQTFTGVFCLNAPRTMIEREYLLAVQERYGR